MCITNIYKTRNWNKITKVYYILCIYESETFRSRLIGWLNFILIVGILETANQLIGYSVKVDSTNINTIWHTSLVSHFFA